MNSERDTNSQFPVKSVIISMIIAIIIFGFGGVIIKNQAYISAKGALFFASHGNYELAMNILNIIDINNEPEAYNDGLYNVAIAMMNRGDYDSAYEKLSEMGDYADSRDLAYKCIQKKAIALMERKEYEDASALLKDIMFLDGSEALYDECQYNYALEQIEQGEWRTGAQVLWSIKNYKDAGSIAKQTVFDHTGNSDVESTLGMDNLVTAEQTQEYILLQEKRKQLKDGCISVGFRHTVGLCGDGRVLSCGSNEYGQCDTNEWKNVVQVAAGAYHTVALLEDGTVLACGNNTYGQCEVADWKNVVQIAASDYNTVALLEDGTVVACGYNNFTQIKGWRNISRICVGSYSISGIAVSGELYSTHSSCLIDEKLVDAAMSTAYTIGLTFAGDVVYTSQTASGWTKALSVYAYSSYVAIITPDYKVSIYDRRKGSFYELPQEKNALSVALGGTHFAILYDDGSVYCIGENGDGQCETDSWNLGIR